MALIGDDVNENRRPLMSVVFRRFTIDASVVFENKEDESVVEGGVINLQTICAKADQRSVSKQRRLLFVRWELGKKGGATRDGNLNDISKI